MRATTLFIFALALTLTAGVIRSQSPAPIVVQAVSAAPKPAAAVAAVAPAAVDVHSAEEVIKLLEQIKAANNEVLAKQKAALERLDELQQAAEQLKIFAKRG
jgi:hypothetical protein